MSERVLSEREKMGCGFLVLVIICVFFVLPVGVLLWKLALGWR